MQTIFSLRPSDGRIMRFNSSWVELGTFQGLETPRLNEQMAVNWFKYKGLLYCAALAAQKVIVGRFENNDLSVVASVASNPVNAAWGNTINYNGKICWLEQNTTGTLFYSFDGETVTSATVDIPMSSEFSQSGCELNLVQLGNQLAVLPKSLSVCGHDSKIESTLRNVICLLDITSNGILVTTAAGINVPALNVTIPTSKATAGTDLRASIVGAGIYRDRIVALFADGKLARVASDGRSVLADVTNDTSMRLGRYGTELDGTDDAQAVVNLRHAQVDAAPYLLGTRIFVCSGPHAGISGLVAWVEGNDSLRLSIASDTPEPFPALVANTEISFGRGVAGGFCCEPRCSTVPGPLVHTFFFEVSDALYGVVLGRHPNIPVKANRQAQPSFMARVRGDAVVVAPLLLNNEPLNAWSAQARLDYTDSAIHIVYYDAQAKAVRHLRYGIASSILSDLGTVYASDSLVHLAAGNLIGYDAGELDIILGTIEADSATGDVNIGFEVFGTDPTNRLIEFFYNIGGEWLPATLSQSPATPNVFAHALRIDQPSFSGDIQYRANISRP